MTILFPDVSEYNGAYRFAGYPVALARATISTVQDTQWRINQINAANVGTRLAAYAFLNAPSLGVSVNDQADFAYRVIGPGVPMMIDLEPNRGACASLSDGLNFAARFRANGGTTHLIYLPKWSWSGSMGSPSLVPLSTAGLNLVSSNYTSYSDTGPGWTAYGGVNPIQWQYTDNFNGTGADGNAYRGTADQWWAMATATPTGADMQWSDPAMPSRLGNTSVFANADPVIADLFSVLNGRGSVYVTDRVVKPPLGAQIDRVEADVVGVAQRLDALAAAVAAIPTSTLTDTQITVMANAVAKAVLVGFDPLGRLSEADLVSVQARTEAAIRDVLGGLG